MPIFFAFSNYYPQSMLAIVTTEERSSTVFISDGKLWVSFFDEGCYFLPFMGRSEKHFSFNMTKKRFRTTIQKHFSVPCGGGLLYSFLSIVSSIHRVWTTHMCFPMTIRLVIYFTVVMIDACRVDIWLGTLILHRHWCLEHDNLFAHTKPRHKCHRHGIRSMNCTRFPTLVPPSSLTEYSRCLISYII